MGRGRRLVFLGGKWEVLYLKVGNCSDRILLMAILQVILSLWGNYWAQGWRIAEPAGVEFSRIV